MSLSSSKKKLKALRGKWTDPNQRITEIIKRRLERFRRGKISSEEFEKETREERDLTRLSKKIMRFGKEKFKSERWRVGIRRHR